jgi:hypothetical protein
MTSFSDPHETGLRMPPFQKHVKTEEFFARLNAHLAAFDHRESSSEQNYPLIFVVGLPRSGTTLLSQLLSRYLPVGYVNNLVARFWRNPLVGIRLSQAVFGPEIRDQIEFKSIHGVTADPWGPHEFGYFWSYWLRLDNSPTHKLTQAHLETLDQLGLAMTLSSMANASQSPFVFKNIICGLQAAFLTRIYPKSLFIYIDRDHHDVASSLLRSRHERYGEETVWWSLKPSTFNEIHRLPSPLQQIDRQIADGHREFLTELTKPGVNLIQITYEDLCLDPSRCLLKIVNALAELGYSISLLETPQPLNLTTYMSAKPCSRSGECP